MSLSYDVFISSFLDKISEYEFREMHAETRTAITDKCLKRALQHFKKNCKYDLITTADDANRIFNVDISEADIDEIVDIVSEGMLVQWLKPFVNSQEILQNTLNTRDFTTYSPAELLHRVCNRYSQAKKDYQNMIREYSYNHGDLEDLHL